MVKWQSRIEILCMSAKRCDMWVTILVFLGLDNPNVKQFVLVCACSSVYHFASTKPQ